MNESTYKAGLAGALVAHATGMLTLAAQLRGEIPALHNNSIFQVLDITGAEFASLVEKYRVAFEPYEVTQKQRPEEIKSKHYQHPSHNTGLTENQRFALMRESGVNERPRDPAQAVEPDMPPPLNHPKSGPAVSYSSYDGHHPGRTVTHARADDDGVSTAYDDGSSIP